MSQSYSDPTEKKKLFRGGAWCKFDKYLIDEGLIRPAPDAKLKIYEPWEIYDATGGQRPQAEPPYRDFLNLAKEISLCLQSNPLLPPRVPTSESEERILEWCNKYGLLGILPALARTITLAPCWRLMPESEQTSRSRAPVPAYRKYLKEGSGWRVITQFNDSTEARRLPLKDKQEGRPVPREVVPDQWPKPSAFMRLWDSYRWKEEPLSGDFRKFFPSIPREDWEHYQYPAPGTEEFWKIYAEPVEIFHDWSLKFQSCTRALDRLATKGIRTRQQKKALAEVDLFLGSLASTVSPSFDVVRGKLTQRWSSASLASSFAFMMILDATVGRRPLACTRCGTWFISDSPRALYCSPRCRRTMQMRRYRKKHG